MDTPIGRFRAWMEDQGLTHKAAAMRLGCDASYPTHILSGNRRPGLTVAMAIERATATWSGGVIRAEEWLAGGEHSPIVRPAAAEGE